MKKNLSKDTLRFHVRLAYLACKYKDISNDVANILEISNDLADTLSECQSVQDDLLVEIVSLQQRLDYRTEIENKAIELISQCKFEEAQELLKTI